MHVIQIIGNICSRVFDNNVFGFFEQVRKQRFSKNYIGRFRKAHGRAPFIETLGYQGEEVYSEEQPLLLNKKSGNILFLQPLLFWDICVKHSNVHEGHCYYYDRFDSKRGTYTFKAAEFNCACNVSSSNEYALLAEQLDEMMKNDCITEICKAGEFRKVEII